MRSESGNLTVDEQLSAGYMAANASYPYFASGLSLLVRKIAEIPSRTMAVTRGAVLLVDPRFIEKCTTRQLAEVLVHELNHVLRDHGERSDRVLAVDRLRWNVAADCEINCGLQREHLPGDPCLPSSFGLPDGLLAEEYYEKLPILVACGGSVCSGGCGGGSGGEKVAGEPDEDDLDSRGRADIERVRNEVADAVVVRSCRGRVPGDLLRWARDRLLPPKIRWREVLSRRIRGEVATLGGKVDYSFQRPNRMQSCVAAVARRLGGQSVILPSLVGRVPGVAVGVDTSGSMGEEKLAAAMSEIDGVLRATGAEATFLACDCALTGPIRKVRSAGEAALSLRGGGGTDFRPVMAAVEKMRPRPGLFVFCTDGDGQAPDRPPLGVRVLWVLIGDDAQSPCGWGERIFVEEDVR